MSGARDKRKKHRLFWEQNGLCYWCKTPMELTFHHARHHRLSHATLEHLDDRFSDERGQNSGRRVVLACLRCNHTRGIEQQAAQPIEELWRRSGRARSSTGSEQRNSTSQVGGSSPPALASPPSEVNR